MRALPATRRRVGWFSRALRAGILTVDGGTSPLPTSHAMPLLATDAIVLHAFDYLESSRILRLVTREAGVRSALARGARRSRRRFGSALDLFAQGSARALRRSRAATSTRSARFDVDARAAAARGRTSAASPARRRSPS